MKIHVWAMAVVWPAGMGVAQPPPMAVVSPEVHADRTITFRMMAPNAKEVTLSGEFTRTPIAMTKDEKGVWSATTPAVRPDVYGYSFKVDGFNTPDPSNTYVRVGSLALGSQVEVPGEEAQFLAIRDVPHGQLHDIWYQSKATNTVRRVIVYTPPGYETGAVTNYPVLYLLHGMGDDEAFWTSVGRANFVFDNLLAERKAKPALIVMPFGHASRNMAARGRGGRGAGVPAGAPAATGGPAAGRGAPGGMFEVPMLESDLKQSIMPLVEAQFRVKKDRTARAIAGLSMGGYQSMAIGLNNLATFSAVGAFSSALVGGSFESVVPEFLAAPEKANKELRLFWLGCGDIDGLLAGNQNFEAALRTKNIRHEWTLTPGYAHWWTLWRVYLREFLTGAFPPEKA